MRRRGGRTALAGRFAMVVRSSREKGPMDAKTALRALVRGLHRSKAIDEALPGQQASRSLRIRNVATSPVGRHS